MRSVESARGNAQSTAKTQIEYSTGHGKQAAKRGTNSEASKHYAVRHPKRGPRKHPHACARPHKQGTLLSMTCTSLTAEQREKYCTVSPPHSMQRSRDTQVHVSVGPFLFAQQMAYRLTIELLYCLPPSDAGSCGTHTVLANCTSVVLRRFGRRGW